MDELRVQTGCKDDDLRRIQDETTKLDDSEDIGV